MDLFGDLTPRRIFSARHVLEPHSPLRGSAVLPSIWMGCRPRATLVRKMSVPAHPRHGQGRTESFIGRAGVRRGYSILLGVGVLGFAWMANWWVLSVVIQH